MPYLRLSEQMKVNSIKMLRNMNTVLLMFAIMGLVCRYKAPGGSFRNLKFDLLYKYTYRHSLQGLQFPEPQITDQLEISPKIIHLTLCLF